MSVTTNGNKITKYTEQLKTRLMNKRSGDATGEFLLLFISLVIGLSLVGVLNSFASTASVSAFPSSANTATLYGLIPLFLAIVFIAIVAGVAYREVRKFQHSRQFTEMGYNPVSGVWMAITNSTRAILPTNPFLPN